LNWVKCGPSPKLSHWNLIVDPEECKGWALFHCSSASPLSAPKSPTLRVPHPLPTHHFPSLNHGTYFDCYYHVDDDDDAL